METKIRWKAETSDNGRIAFMKKLAINGGDRVRTKPWTENLLDIDRDEIFEVMDVLKSKRLGQLSAKREESKVDKFEEELAKYFHVKYAIVCNSGMTALTASLYAVGAGAGDEVLVPAFDALMGIQGVIAACARPVFVDIDPKTNNMSPEEIPKRITKRTKAIMPVHWGGYPVDMDPIIEVAEEYNLPVIEDAAHAHGSEYKGKKCGSLGTVAGASLWEYKPLGVGEGGVVTTNDPEIASKVSTFINNGRVIKEPGFTIGTAMKAGKIGAPVTMGWTARMTELQAAIGLAQLRKLDAHLEKLNKFWAYLRKEIGQLDGIIEPYLAPYATILNGKMRGPALYIMNPGFGVDEVKLHVNAVQIAMAIRAEGVPCGTLTEPIYLNPMLQRKIGYGRGCPYDCPHFDEHVIYQKGLCPKAESVVGKSFGFPLYPSMTQEDVEDIVKATEKVVHAVQRGAKIPI